MSIASEITRLNNAKAAIKQSLANKGVEVSDSALLDEYPALIDKISGEGSGSGGEGGSGGVDPFYETIWYYITNGETNYNYLFHGSNATSMNLSELKTSGVKYMNNMFEYSNNLTTLDVSGFDTSSVDQMTYMFRGCSKLATLEGLSNWDVSSVTNMNYFLNSCSKLTSIDLSGWTTSKLTYVEYMFGNCSKLTTLDVSGWDTSNMTSPKYMFYSCSNLTTLDVSGWDTSNFTSIGSMFYYCKNLTDLDLSTWDLSKCTSSSAFSSTFNECTALVNFKAPKNISANISFSDSYNLSHDSLMSIINNLVTVASTKTLTLGTTNLAKLTDEEKAIATGKGWTVK